MKDSVCRRPVPAVALASASGGSIAGLTSIRGIASVAVLLFHVQQTFPDARLPLIDWFVHGALGVDLFFVLSGFILAYVYQGAMRATSPAIFFPRFIMARLARVYPLHVATLLTTLLLVSLLPGFYERAPQMFTAFGFALNLLLVQNWGLIGISWNIPSWSISAEWFMYLLFPGLLIFWQALRTNASTRPKLALGLAIGFTALHGAVILAMGWTHLGGMALGGMVRVFFEFLIGFFVCEARTVWARPAGFKGAMFDAFVVSGILIAFVAPAGWVLFVPAAAVLIWTLGCDAGPLARAMRVRPLVYLGNISFSLYMWHWLVIQFHNLLREQGLFRVDTRGQLLLHCTSMLVCSFAIAALSYRWIEIPMRAALRPTERRVRPGSVEAQNGSMTSCSTP